MVSITPISAPFLPISRLCAIELANFGNRLLPSWLLWQLILMGITFDNGPDGSSITPNLHLDPFYPK